LSNSKLTFTAHPATRLSGRIRVPGDKSMSHRSIMFGAIAHGTTTVSGFLEGEDSLHTLDAFRAMGVRIERGGPGEVTLYGKGPEGLSPASAPIYLGNSGTGMRLMSGLLAGLNLPTTLTGDESLSGRPMRRIVDPLNTMGASIKTADDGTPPLHIERCEQLHGIEYTCPIASAQVKSAILLAGLSADGKTTVHEPAVTRDHTERMLRGFGVDVTSDGLTASIEGGQSLTATSLTVPGDISSSAFYLVGASMTPGSDLTIEGVGMNPSRTGVIDILRLMGASIDVRNQRDAGGEPVADLHVIGGQLRGIEVPENKTVVNGAEELRVKETDRIQVMTDGLRALGASIEDTPDGARIQGGVDGAARLAGGTADSVGDHRTAMAFSMASLISDGPITILDCANVNTSFPGFADLANANGLQVDVS